MNVVFTLLILASWHTSPQWPLGQSDPVPNVEVYYGEPITEYYTPKPSIFRKYKRTTFGAILVCVTAGLAVILFPVAVLIDRYRTLPPADGLTDNCDQDDGGCK